MASSSTATKNSKRKRGEPIYNISTNNSFAIFSDEEDADESMNIENNEENSKPKPFPPIIVNKSFEHCISTTTLIREHLIGELNIKYKKNKTIFITYNDADFKKAQEIFKAENIEFHTYTPNDEIKPKFVLKGIPPTINTEDIHQDLSSQGLQIFRIIQMVNKKVTPNVKLPMWIVTLQNKAQIPTLCKIKYVCHIVVEWDNYKSSNVLTICYNCQDYNHLASNCNKKPKCRKCAGEHLSLNCTKDTETNFKPTCANCEGDHYSSDNKCPVYERNVSLKLSKQVPKVPLTPFKKKDFPQLPKPSSKWPADKFQSTETGPSITDTFKDVKNFLSSFNLSNILRNIKYLMSKVSQAEDGMSKLFVLIEGIINIFD